MSRGFLPLALISVGVFFLLANLISGPGRGGLFLIGLGVAFAVGRVTTGRYGYSVPAGILVAVGLYISLQELFGPTGARSSGWFFVLLGGGFLLAYAVGMRPQVIWPLFPATILICLGLVLFGASAASLASLSWITAYWPLVLVLVGAWLLFRDSLPQPVRSPVATIGGLGLLGYGVLAALATVSAAGSLARPGFGFNFGATPFADEITLDQPIAPGDTFRVANTSGKTIIHGGSGNTIHVVATRHFVQDGHPPEVQLTPIDHGVNLQLAEVGRPTFGPASWADYTIEVPTSVQVDARAASGAIEITDVTGAVQAEATSGSIQLTNIAGDVRAKATSGQIRGTSLRHVRDAQADSGSISLQGVFTDPAQIKAGSGSIELNFAPDSAVQIDASVSSGSVTTRGLPLTTQKQERNALVGTLGAPAPGAVMTIQARSGSITLSQ